MSDKPKIRPELSLSDELVNFFRHQFTEPLYTSEISLINYLGKFLKEYSCIKDLEGQKMVWEQVKEYQFLSEAPNVRADNEVIRLSKEIEKRTSDLLNRYKKEEVRIN